MREPLILPKTSHRKNLESALPQLIFARMEIAFAKCISEISQTVYNFYGFIANCLTETG
jgi:hypothetical protein